MRDSLCFFPDCVRSHRDRQSQADHTVLPRVSLLWRFGHVKPKHLLESQISKQKSQISKQKKISKQKSQIPKQKSQISKQTKSLLKIKPQTARRHRRWVCDPCMDRLAQDVPADRRTQFRPGRDPTPNGWVEVNRREEDNNMAEEY